MKKMNPSTRRGILWCLILLLSAAPVVFKHGTKLFSNSTTMPGSIVITDRVGNTISLPALSETSKSGEVMKSGCAVRAARRAMYTGIVERGGVVRTTLVYRRGGAARMQAAHRDRYAYSYERQNCTEGSNEEDLFLQRYKI